MQRVMGWLNRLEERILTVTLIALAVVAFAQVCTRYTIGLSFDWFEEGGRYMGVFITFLGASIGVRRGTHFSMELLVDSLPPAWGKALKIAVGVFSACVLFLVAWYGFKLVGRNYRFEVNSAAIGVPMYLVYLPIPVFSVLIGVRFLLVSAGLLRSRAAAEGE